MCRKNHARFRLFAAHNPHLLTATKKFNFYELPTRYFTRGGYENA